MRPSVGELQKRMLPKAAVCDESGRVRRKLLQVAVCQKSLHSRASRRAKGTILPTRVSRKKESTSGVARTPSNPSCTAGARSVFHSHNLAILLHMSRSWPSHVGHLPKQPGARRLRKAIVPESDHVRKAAKEANAVYERL